MKLLLCLILCTLSFDKSASPTKEELAIANACAQTMVNDWSVEAFEKLLAPNARQLKGEKLAMDFITANAQLLGKDSAFRKSVKFEALEPICITETNMAEAFVKVHDFLDADAQAKMKKKTIPMKDGKVVLDALKKKWPNLFDELAQGRTAFFLPCVAVERGEKRPLSMFIVVAKVDESFRITLLEDK